MKPSDVYMRHQPRPSLVQVMVWRLFGARSLSDPMLYYSETTWAVGIAQFTHHEVQGGGKNPETGGRGIFAPTADRVVS